MKKPAPESPDFTEMVKLLAVFTDATNSINVIETEANGELLEILDDKKADYSKLQEALTQSEAAVEVIVRRHPEWFTERASIKTPYGTVKFTTSNYLVIPNEEVSTLLIEQEAEKNPEFNRDEFISTKKVLSVEALEKLDDATLKRLRITRASDKNVKVVAAKVDMGKAVKEALDSKAVEARS